MFHQRTTTATMPARTTGAPGASTGQAILAAAQSAFFQQQQQQQQQQAPHHNNGKITTKASSVVLHTNDELIFRIGRQWNRLFA